MIRVRVLFGRAMFRSLLSQINMEGFELNERHSDTPRGGCSYTFKLKLGEVTVSGVINFPLMTYW